MRSWSDTVPSHDILHTLLDTTAGTDTTTSNDASVIYDKYTLGMIERDILWYTWKGTNYDVRLLHRMIY
jgi:hypothetical protein